MFKAIISTLFPNMCAACHTIIEDGEFLCDYCFCMLETKLDRKVCEKCGCEKEKCQCRYSVFYFDRLTSAFYNSTTAKKAMYAFKFKRDIRVGRFFAEKMALEVKQTYYGINFDLITFVPMAKGSSLKRRFNQSEILAEQIADILEIPFENNILYCKRKRKPQHKVLFKERFKNVKDIYYAKSDISGKTVLLVDDIKTSGATLSECAKQLYIAGASKVYCVTGLITKFKKGKTNGN